MHADYTRKRSVWSVVASSRAIGWVAGVGSQWEAGELTDSQWQWWMAPRFHHHHRDTTVYRWTRTTAPISYSLLTHTHTYRVTQKLRTQVVWKISLSIKWCFYNKIREIQSAPSSSWHNYRHSAETAPLWLVGPLSANYHNLCKYSKFVAHCPHVSYTKFLQHRT